MYIQTALTCNLCLTRVPSFIDSSLYAIHVFNVFDQDRDGKVSFEVSFYFVVRRNDTDKKRTNCT